ncbi:hypothetical protein LguiB_003773 [Lonicera macranthoides]
MDNRGTARCGLKFEGALKNNCGRTDMEDQPAGTMVQSRGFGSHLGHSIFNSDTGLVYEVLIFPDEQHMPWPRQDSLHGREDLGVYREESVLRAENIVQNTSVVRDRGNECTPVIGNRNYSQYSVVRGRSM